MSWRLFLLNDNWGRSRSLLNIILLPIVVCQCLIIDWWIGEFVQHSWFVYHLSLHVYHLSSSKLLIDDCCICNNWRFFFRLICLKRFLKRLISCFSKIDLVVLITNIFKRHFMVWRFIQSSIMFLSNFKQEIVLLNLRSKDMINIRSVRCWTTCCRTS